MTIPKSWEVVMTRIIVSKVYGENEEKAKENALNGYGDEIPEDTEILFISEIKKSSNRSV